MQVEFVIQAWKMTGTVALRPEGAWHKLAKHQNKKEDTGSGKERVGEGGKPGAGRRETGSPGTAMTSPRKHSLETIGHET